MKKIISLALALCLVTFAFAQTTIPPTATTPPIKKDWSKVNLSNQAADHFMIQLGTDHWANMPDSIGSHQKSLAFGIGIGSSSIFFNDVNIDLARTGTTSLPFDDDSASYHYKKYKLETSFLEIPIELRYTFNPEKQSKSWKLALGIKPGTMLDAHTKGVDGLDGNGNQLNTSTAKLSSTSFFNTSRICASARVGYGNLSVFTNYQITSMFKTGGAAVNYYQIGLAISGL
jgi:Outer membrane protein beta-barrel domain